MNGRTEKYAEFDKVTWAGVEIPDVFLDDNGLLDEGFDNGTSANEWRELLDCDDVLREEPLLSFHYLFGNSSSMVVRRVCLASGEEQCLDAYCSDVFASSGNVEDLGCDETLKGESWSIIGSEIRGKAL